MPKTKTLPYLEALFSVIVWGASFIATKIAVGQVSPVAVVWIRFSIGLPILFLAVFMRRQFALPKKDEWLYFALLGFIGIAFHQWLQSNGLITAQATTTAWIITTTPAFIAALGWLVLKEKLTAVQFFGIALATLGVLVVVGKGNPASLAAGKFGAIGDLLILISALNWAVFSTLSRRGLRERPSAMLTLWVMTFGWLFTSVAFFASRGYAEIPALDSRGWQALIYLGVFTTGLAYIAWFDALAQLPAAQTGAFLFIEPLSSMAVAAVVLNEAVTLASVFGGAVIILGIWLVNRKG
ncbi:MAG: EamA/RhaT family transporter [Chloroflexi bacterium]|nr:DMT family transporter [Chloroflexi bacterium CFX1]MCK6569092.1 DMT family transporter [Anaerolineales bacterium]MCQ3952134.1 EamA/RhaT family transporter [Chloroflexota bacterium]MDL1918810.1 DMT family transporter [Chloroflexi bacterium CFX5]NUQ57947.1 DMT family transporter [Anaerolineales bacterium]